MKNKWWIDDIALLENFTEIRADIYAVLYSEKTSCYENLTYRIRYGIENDEILYMHPGGGHIEKIKHQIKQKIVKIIKNIARGVDKWEVKNDD